MSADPSLFVDQSSSLDGALLPLSHHPQPPSQQQQQQQTLPPQHAYPHTTPSTPLNHTSPGPATSPSVNISPEALANLTSIAQTAGSPFSAAASVISPTGSTFSAGHLSDISPGGSGDGSYGMTAAMALANAVGMNGTGGLPEVGQLGGALQGLQGSSTTLLGQPGMEVDLTFPTPPQSAPSSNGATTPANAPFYYPTGSSSVSAQLVQSSLPPPSHPAPTIASTQRHHPYAHPSRPSINTSHTQGSSTSIPLYLSTASSPATAHGGTPPPPSAGSEAPSSSLALGLPSTAPHGPQRVHSAPAHILTLSTHGLDGLSGSPLASATSETPSAVEQRRLVGGDGGLSLASSISSLNSSAGPGSAAGTPVTALAPAFGATSLEQQQQQQAPPPPSSVASVQAEDDRMAGYNEPVTKTISLLVKRLTIQEAALSSSGKEAGDDEEEIWKGVENTYEELKRIMADRKDARRLSQGATAMPRFSTMDLESPVTPVDRPHAASAFLAMHAPPPLLHTQSSPDVTLGSQPVAARQAAAQAQAQAHAFQLQQQQQAQLQQAQMQAQAQAEAHARAQAQLQAEAERARAEAEQRARAEEEARAQAEAEARMRAEAEAEAAAQHQAAELARREAEQYQQLLHEDQLRVARERLHQQMQEGAAGAPQHLPNPPPAQPTPTPQPSLVQQQQGQPQPSSQPNPQLPQPPPPQQQSFPPQPHQLVFATPEQAQAFHMQMQGTTQVPGANGQVVLVPVSQLPPGALPPGSLPSTQLGSSAPPLVAQPPAITGQFPVGFDPSGSGDSLMQHVHLPSGLAFAPAPNLPQPPESVDPSALSGAFANAITAPPPAINAPASITPPNTSTSTFVTTPTQPSSSGPGPVRPSRSRAASQSGYTSSGSRSRAASGSGYQVLLESRSRAASSASSVFHTAERDDEDDIDEDGEHGEPDIDVSGDGPSRTSKSSQMGAASAGVDAETKAKMDPVFLDFLADICSNLEATDSKGEPIHQTLMAKKMEKLDQSHDFRPFKFRIQAFTTAFAERLAASGVFDQEVPIKKVRQYLWAQPFISRFNDDGKKAKSKGNHIWTVEAKKIPDKKWMFREFTRCIKGAAPPIAFIGVPWSWAPRVWDPQCSSAAIDASFMSPTLPPWLVWDDNVLSGIPPESAKGQTFEIEAVATFQLGAKVHQLRSTASVLVASPNETDDPASFADVMVSGNLAYLNTRLQPDEDHKPNLSNNSSQVPSPEGSNSALYRSPSLGHSSLFDGPPPSSQYLPPPLNGSGGSSYSNSGLVTPASATGIETGFVPLDQQQQQQMSDQAWPAAMVAAQEQPHSLQPASFGDMQVDDSQAQTALEQQAALHHHYATLAMQQHQQGQPFEPNGALSYAPAPELVTTALQNAAVNPNMTSVNPGMLSHAPSGAGTPGGVFQLHDIGQQPPLTTLDPSAL
ncbi:hypothetical protein JCM8097_003674 [Rhodosporidiobolus ruineniae]